MASILDVKTGLNAARSISWKARTGARGNSLGRSLGNFGKPLDQPVNDDLGHVIHLFQQLLRVPQRAIAFGELPHARNVVENLPRGPNELRNGQSSDATTYT